MSFLNISSIDYDPLESIINTCSILMVCEVGDGFLLQHPVIQYSFIYNHLKEVTFYKTYTACV